MTQIFNKLVATRVKFISSVEITHVNFDNWFSIVLTSFCPILVLGSGPSISMAKTHSVLQLRRNETPICPLVEIHSACMSDTCLKCVHIDLSYPCSKSVVAWCRTYISPAAVLLIWGRENSITCRPALWYWPRFEGRVRLARSLWGCLYGHTFSMWRGIQLLAQRLHSLSAARSLSHLIMLEPVQFAIWVSYARTIAATFVKSFTNGKEADYTYIVFVSPTAVLFDNVGVSVPDKQHHSLRHIILDKSLVGSLYWKSRRCVSLGFDRRPV